MLELWHQSQISRLDGQGMPPDEIAGELGLDEAETIAYLEEKHSKPKKQKKKSTATRYVRQGEDRMISSGTPMTKMLKMMEEKMQFDMMSRQMQSPNSPNSGFDINEMMKFAMMGNLMEKTNKTGSDAMMPMIMFMLNNSKNNGMDYNMIKAMVDNNKGDDKWMELFKFINSDKGKANETGWYEKMLQLQQQSANDRMSLMEQMRDRDRKYWAEKVDDVLNKKATNEGWSHDAFKKVENLVVENLMKNFEKGLQGTDTEKSTTDSVLATIGSVMKEVGPILKPMAEATAQQIKEQGVRQTFTPQQQAQASAQQTPEQQAVDQAMQAQVQAQQQAQQQAQPQAQPQPVPFTHPVMGYDDDFDFVKNPQRR